MKKTLTIALALMNDGTVLREVPFDRRVYAPDAGLIITRGEDGTLEVWKDRYGTNNVTVSNEEAEARLRVHLREQAAK